MKIALALALAATLATPAIAGCDATLTYDQMARTPTQYAGQAVKLCGRVTSAPRGRPYRNAR